MRMPGFTADAALSPRSQEYRHQTYKSALANMVGQAATLMPARIVITNDDIYCFNDCIRRGGNKVFCNLYCFGQVL